MTAVVEPASNAVFYISRDPPKNDTQWQALQSQATRLLEAARSLEKAAQAADSQWQDDLRLFIDAAEAADTAARARNQAALEDLNDALYTACMTCHEHFMPKR